jgi:predicted nucleic acid-binding protein
MADRPLRVFLDTNVVIAALQGRRGAGVLFDSELERAALYVVNSIVIQELLLMSASGGIKLDLGELAKHLSISDIEQPLDPAEFARIWRIRNRVAHANELLILGAARDCDLLLTYDKDLLRIGKESGVVAQTPEDFLATLGATS